MKRPSAVTTLRGYWLSLWWNVRTPYGLWQNAWEILSTYFLRLFMICFKIAKVAYPQYRQRETLYDNLIGTAEMSLTRMVKLERVRYHYQVVAYLWAYDELPDGKIRPYYRYNVNMSRQLFLKEYRETLANMMDYGYRWLAKQEALDAATGGDTPTGGVGEGETDSFEIPEDGDRPEEHPGAERGGARDLGDERTLPPGDGEGE